MYDDYDYDHDRGRDHQTHNAHHRPRDESDYSRRRSPGPRDQPYRSRHDASRSPRRTPPRPSRGDQSYPRRRSPDGYRHDDRSYDDRDDSYYRRRPSPAYRDHDRPNRHRSPRASSPWDSGDESYHRDGGRRQGPGRPFHTLKLDDVPDRVNSQELEIAMRDLGAHGLVEIRIKSDDKTGSRRSYAFAEFRNDDDAADFLEQYYPAFETRRSNGSKMRIHIEYSHERKSNAHQDDWFCTMCNFENFSRRSACKQCKAPRTVEMPMAMDVTLNGESDECPQQTPNLFLVIRELASSVNENSLASGVKQLYLSKADEQKPVGAKLKSTAPVGNTSGLGARPGSLTRVFMIRDKASEISCNYGFAEFATLEDARSAMAKYKATPQFTVNGKTSTVAYIHAGVFVPYIHPGSDEDSKYSFSATHDSSLRLAYWNQSVFASELTLFNESLYEDKTQAPGDVKTDSEPSKESKKRKAEKDIAPASGKKTIAMAPQLQMWAKKHAELAGNKEALKRVELGDDKKAPATGPNAVGPSIKISTTNMPSALSVSYADLDQMCCLLCRRRFKNEPSLRRHEQASDMHKGNLQNDELKVKATQDLKALGKEPVTNYRDRAKERRHAYSQPTKPKAAHLPRKNPSSSQSNTTTTNNNTNSTKSAEPGRDTSPTAAAKQPSSSMSRGAGLLAKMGWTKGEGLGAEGDGRKNIIETLAYAPGVGLGAEGGKLGDAAEEAARATKGEYVDFVSKTKDKARERYEKM